MSKYVYRTSARAVTDAVLAVARSPDSRYEFVVGPELDAANEAFNARIALPVRWDTGIKHVLSGLSENSWGDGRSKATVEHVYLLEPLQAGRLVRQAGDFLCTQASGTNGKRWSTTVERGHDGDGAPFQPKVTCRACLGLAERWMRH